MYEHDEILSLISRLREETDKWEAEIKAGDFKKFYQKNNSSAGKRIRSICLTMMKRCKIIRNDIKRTMKEREIFKGTEDEQNFKNYRKHKPATR